MKKQSKRLLSVVLTLVMALGLLPTGLFTVTASAATVDSANFTVRHPVGSERAHSYSVTCDNDKVVIYDVEWHKGENDTGKLLTAEDTFTAGEAYTLKFKVTCADDYTFGVSCKPTLNENAVSLDSEESVLYYTISYVFYAKDDHYANLPADSYYTFWVPVYDIPDEGYGEEYQAVRKLFQDERTLALRLEEDVYFEDDNFNGWEIVGKKYLDLNGHTLKFRRPNGYTHTLFTVPEDAEFVLLDNSKKGDGSINYDGWIYEGADYDSGHLAVRNIFSVSGKLTINGGKLDVGRSKKQWLEVAAREGEVEGYAFNGYVRNQVNGCGVIVENGGELTVNGGYVTGRGFEYLTSGYVNDVYQHVDAEYTSCAAIRMKAGAKVTLNDGFFKGYGCGDVLQVEDGCDLTVKSGEFDTKKIDKVRLPQASITNWWFGGERDNYMNGFYGDIGIPEGAIDTTKTDLIVGGEEQEPDEDGNVSAAFTSKKTYVQPKEVIPVNSGIQPFIGIAMASSTGLWTVGQPGWIHTRMPEDERYYEDNILAYDYMDATFQGDVYYWMLTKNGKYVGSQYTSCYQSYCNLNDFTDSDGDPIDWEEGALYTVTASFNEVWDSYTDYTILHKLGTFNFRPSTLDYSQLAGYTPVSVVPTGYVYKSSDGDYYGQYYLKLNTDGLVPFLNKWVTDGTIQDWQVEVFNDEYIPGYGTYTNRYVFTRTNTSDRIVSTPQAGFMPLDVNIRVQNAAGDWSYVDCRYIDVLVMSTIRASGAVETTGNPGYVKLTEPDNYDAWVKLDAGFDRMTAAGRDIYSGGTLAGTAIDQSRIYWQYEESEDNWVDIKTMQAGMVLGSLMGTGESNNFLYVRQDGRYRACYQVDNTVYTSPFPLYVTSFAEFNAYPAKITASTTRTVLGGGATLSVDLSTELGVQSKWSDNLSVQFTLVSQPAGAKGWTGSTKNSDGYKDYYSADGMSYTIDGFFKEQADRIVPGEYVFKARVTDLDTGTENPNGTWSGIVRTTTDLISVYYDYEADHVDIYADGENLTNGTGSGSYLLPGDTKTMNFKAMLSPEKATCLNYGNSWSASWSVVGDTRVGTIDEKTGKFTALTPGTTKIRLQAIDGVTKQVKYMTFLDVTVPIAGFTVEKPTLTYGMKIADIRPTITAVWSYDGEKQTTDTSRWLTVDARYLTSTYYGRLSIKSTDTVDYNNTYGIIFAYKPTSGNQFVLTYGDVLNHSDYQVPDLQYIAANTFDSTAVGNDPDRGYLVQDQGDEGCYCEDWIDGTKDSTWLYYEYHFERVPEPGAVYIDTVSIFLADPAVGETAVQGGGAELNDIKFLSGKITSMTGVVDSSGNPVLDYYSRVYQMNGELAGSGIPYDDASSEKLTDIENYKWYMNAVFWQIFTPEEREEYNAEEQFYQAGIHVNELGINVKENGADGTVYYFSPNAKLFVNGVPVSSTVENGAYRISAKYYFDVGEIDVYDSVTVDGVKKPVAGEKPVTLDDLTCTDADGRTDTLYASRLTYFIDKDNDGVCDDGEQALVRYDEKGNYDAENSTLAGDGTFLYNTVYKVMVSIGREAGAEGRFQIGNFTVKLLLDDDSEVYANTLYTTSGAPEGAVYAFEKTGIEPIRKYEASLVADVGTSQYAVAFDPWPTSETHHFRNSSYGYKEQNGEWTRNNLEDGKNYVFEAEFVADDGYYFANDMTVVIDGVTLTSGVTVPTVGGGRYLNISYPISFGAAATGVTVSGTVTSFNSDTDEVTIQLIKQGMSEADYEAVVKGNTATYSISGVLPGTYTMKVMKKNHVTREYTVTVGSESVTQDAKICLLGDVVADGSVDAKDILKLRKHVANPSANPLSDYELMVADVVTDKVVDAKDVLKLRKYVANPTANPLS